jgi:hypothetical protein
MIDVSTRFDGNVLCSLLMRAATSSYPSKNPAIYLTAFDFIDAIWTARPRMYPTDLPSLYPIE